MDQKANVKDKVILNARALRSYRYSIGTKVGRIIDVEYEFTLARYLYYVSFPGIHMVYLFSYEFDKVK
jgi:hypothetical protein